MVVALAALEAGVDHPSTRSSARAFRARQRRSSIAGSAAATARSRCARRSRSPATATSTRRPGGSASIGSPRWRPLGLGAPLGIDLPHERGGLMPTRLEDGARQGWSTGETVDHRHRPGLRPGDAAAAGDDGGTHRQRRAAPVVPRRRARPSAGLAPKPIGPASGRTSRWCAMACTRSSTAPGGTAGGGDPHSRHRDGRQDRDVAGAAHLPRPSGQRASSRTSDLPWAARPRAVHRLRACRQRRAIAVAVVVEHWRRRARRRRRRSPATSCSTRCKLDASRIADARRTAAARRGRGG